MAADDAVHTVASLARRVGGSVRGRGEIVIRGVNSVDDAQPDQITFIHDQKHAKRWPSSRAAAALISSELAIEPAGDAGRAVIVVPNAENAMSQLLKLFQPPDRMPEIGVHPLAFVHPTARVGKDCRIGAHVSVEAGASIGAGTILHPGARIYADVVIGERCVVHSNTVVRERCRIGSNVILHPNVSIGADGFGYRPAPDGSGVAKVPQIGIVVIEDDVEIGANSCVDRAKFGQTLIGAGTKIDNLVQIAHNCRVGRGCLIAGLCGLAGSVVLGDGVQLGGNVGVADHAHIGDGAKIGAKSGVMGDIPAGQVWYGYPASERREALRQVAAVRKLPALIERLSRHHPDGGS